MTSCSLPLASKRPVTSTLLAYANKSATFSDSERAAGVEFLSLCHICFITLHASKVAKQVIVFVLSTRVSVDEFVSLSAQEN